MQRLEDGDDGELTSIHLEAKKARDLAAKEACRRPRAPTPFREFLSPLPGRRPDTPFDEGAHRRRAVLLDGIPEREETLTVPQPAPPQPAPPKAAPKQSVGGTFTSLFSRKSAAQRLKEAEQIRLKNAAERWKDPAVRLEEAARQVRQFFL